MFLKKIRNLVFNMEFFQDCFTIPSFFKNDDIYLESLVSYL